MPEIRGGISTYDGTVYAGGEHRLVTLDAETGDSGWEFSLKQHETSSCPVVRDGTVFVGTFPGRQERPKLYAVTTAGEEDWSAELASRGGITTPAITDERVFAGTGVMGGDHSLVAHDVSTGDEEWRVDLNAHPVGSSPVVSDGVVYLESAPTHLILIGSVRPSFHPFQSS